MKLLVVLVALFITLGLAIALVPDDNSHYVEGESRYIWVPDGEGIPHLVDLYEDENNKRPPGRNGANNQYWLYTRLNRFTPQLLVFGNASSVYQSHYDPNNPLVVIVHGWRSDGNSEINRITVPTFLDLMHVNVIVVDWSHLAYSLYPTASKGVTDVGEFLGRFLIWLFDMGGTWDSVHLIGFSLGAHIVGIAGRTANSRPARITGLDPAGPGFGSNDTTLTSHDGQYVEVIHTDGGLLGTFEPIGDADFYPNGGSNPQPGCWISTCSHSRAYQLFASTIELRSHIGQLCLDLKEARTETCSGNEFLHMGNANITKRGSGLFGLTTERAWPF